MRGQDFLKLQYSKPLLANILWTNTSSILAGHAARKKGKEHGQEKAAFLAIANNLGWQLTQNEGGAQWEKGETEDIKIFVS